jgi:methylated-DNA-[protein]-cysteine S-methyltransferase
MKARIQKLFIGVVDNPVLGPIWMAVSEVGLVAVQMGGEEENFNQGLATRYGAPPIPSEVQVLPIIHQITTYLKGTRKSFDIPIHWEIMSTFQQKVQQAVYAIPYGETRTYGQIAAQIGSPRAARAVGRANATNPMPLVLPCHRLVGADGSLRGYGGGEGVKTKAWLLDFEKRNRGYF